MFGPHVTFSIFSSVYFIFTSILSGDIFTFNYFPLVAFILSSIVITNKINMDPNQKNLLIFGGHLSFIYLSATIIFRFIYSVFNIIFYFGFFTTIFVVTMVTIFLSSQIPTIANSVFMELIRYSNYYSQIVSIMNRFYNFFLIVRNFTKLILYMSYQKIRDFISESKITLVDVNRNLSDNKYSELGLIELNNMKAEAMLLTNKYVFQPISQKAIEAMLNKNIFDSMLNNPNATAMRGVNYKNSLSANRIDMDLDKVDIDLLEIDDLDESEKDIDNSVDTNVPVNSSPQAETREELRKRLRQNISSKRNQRTGAAAKNIRNQLSNAKVTNPEFANSMKELTQGNNLEKLLASLPANQLNGADPAAMKDFLNKMLK